MSDEETSEKTSEKANEETFHIAAVAGLMTGFVLGVGDEDGFSAQHKLAEHVLGHPIWTHEFTEEGIWNRIQAELIRQHPILAEMLVYDRSAAKRAKVSGDVMTYVRAYIEAVSNACGRTLTFARGNGERKEHPLQSLRRVMPEDVPEDGSGLVTINMRRKPTRRDLLVVLQRLQNLIGDSKAFHGNDRDPHGFAKGQRLLEEAFTLSYEAQGFDPPVKQSGPWSDEREEEVVS